MPTLELDDGRILSESLIVADFLDEIGDSSKSLYPKCPYQKAKDKLLVERFNLVKFSLRNDATKNNLTKLNLGDT